MYYTGDMDFMHAIITSFIGNFNLDSNAIIIDKGMSDPMSASLPELLQVLALTLDSVVAIL